MPRRKRALLLAATLLSVDECVVYQGKVDAKHR